MSQPPLPPSPPPAPTPPPGLRGGERGVSVRLLISTVMSVVSIIVFGSVLGVISYDLEPVGIQPRDGLEDLAAIVMSIHGILGIFWLALPLAAFLLTVGLPPAPGKLPARVLSLIAVGLFVLTQVVPELISDPPFFL